VFGYNLLNSAAGTLYILTLWGISKMRLGFKNYTVDIVDDSNYALNSADNVVSYDIEYFDGMINTDRVYPTSKHGIRISKDGDELRSVIICEFGAGTTVHDNSALVTNDSILICCSNKVYSLSIPDLKLNWKKRFDPATCFAIYTFKQDFVVHGELQITRIDKDGNEKWSFGARDIFVTPDGKDSIELFGDKIKLRDWEGYDYLLNEDGKEIRRF
jgi:hypothetical protein